MDEIDSMLSLIIDMGIIVDGNHPLFLWCRLQGLRQKLDKRNNINTEMMIQIAGEMNRGV